MSARPNIAKRYEVEFVEFDGYTADECDRMVQRLKEFDEDVVTFESEHQWAYDLDRGILNALFSRPGFPSDLGAFVSALLAQSEENSFGIVHIEFY